MLTELEKVQKELADFKKSNEILERQVLELTKSRDLYFAVAEKCVSIAYALRYPFLAVLQQWGKGGGEFNRFFSQTDYLVETTALVENFSRADSELRAYFDFLRTIQDEDTFRENFNNLMYNRDEFFEFIKDLTTTGLLGGQAALPETYAPYPAEVDATEENEVSRQLNEEEMFMGTQVVDGWAKGDLFTEGEKAGALIDHLSTEDKERLFGVVPVEVGETPDVKAVVLPADETPAETPIVVNVPASKTAFGTPPATDEKKPAKK